MIANDDIGANEHISVEVWNRFILKQVAPLVRVIGERCARDGSLSIARFDRQRNLYPIEARTASPLYDIQVEGGAWGAYAYTSVTSGLEWQTSAPIGGKIRRIQCLDGDASADEKVVVFKSTGTGIYVADYLAPTQVPFDENDLDVDYTAGDRICFAVVNSSNIVLQRNYRVHVDIAMAFDTGIS